MRSQEQFLLGYNNGYQLLTSEEPAWNRFLCPLAVYMVTEWRKQDLMFKTEEASCTLDFGQVLSSQSYTGFKFNDELGPDQIPPS